MPIGLDDASAVAGVAAVCVTILHVCIKGFVILSRARNCGRQISHVHLRLELEQLKLFLWAQEVGLFEAPPELRIAWPYVVHVPEILKQLGDLLCDVNKLSHKYGLRLEETSEEIIDLARDESALRRLPSLELQRLDSNTANVFRQRVSPWHRLRWVSGDEKHCRELLSDVRVMNDQLQEMLKHDKGKALKSRIDTLFRTTITNTCSQRDLNLLIEASQESFMSAVAAPAQLRKKSLLSGLFGRRGSKGIVKPDSEHGSSRRPTTPSSPRTTQPNLGLTKPIPESRRMPFSRFTLPDVIQPFKTRQLGYSEDRPVLLEWRASEGCDWKKLESRVDKFSYLLQEMALDPSFHSLPCQGFVKDSQTGRYGYVFDLSLARSSNAMTSTRGNHRRAGLPTLQTLHDMLAMPSLRPSLNLRVSHAIVLLETIRQLHTAGWLHKELRSENVLFVGQVGESQSDHELLRSSMYLGGYVSARADESYDFTEPLQPDIEADLYRHPSSSLGRLRQQYCKSFDIFSIGCILLELGMWSRMCTILTNLWETASCFRPNATSPPIAARMTPPDTPTYFGNNVNNQDHHIDLIRFRREMLAQLKSGVPEHGGIVELLEAQTGETYARVVVECLNVKTSDWDCGSGMDEHEYALDLEQRALAQLKLLAERL